MLLFKRMSTGIIGRLGSQTIVMWQLVKDRYYAAVKSYDGETQMLTAVEMYHLGKMLIATSGIESDEKIDSAVDVIVSPRKTPLQIRNAALPTRDDCCIALTGKNSISGYLKAQEGK